MNSKEDDKNRKEIISKLQEQAKSVLQLKRSFRQRRPIVIEFSGSPKSGKTSCINSLDFFLKRNGFKVEIVQERASVCPVHNKKSPMFNIWTVCASIVGMLSVLEKKEATCDVLILDRGIFDAFCWFDWLASTGKMEKSQKEVIENFLTMDLIRNRIDIVFAFTASPEISIKREFANLLTDKPGVIMNKPILAEYLDSIKNVYESKKKYFHKVIEINSSKNDQDEIGKDVTEKTLDELKSMFVERIGYISLPNSILDVMGKKKIFPITDIEFNNHLETINFKSREDVEKNALWIQPIPIVVITNTERTKVLAVKKRTKAISSDSPEKDKILLYIGGHSRSEDSTESNSSDFLSVCRYTLRREINEELGISIAIDDIIPFIIYTPNTPKSKQHIGICFLVETNINDIKLKIDEEELILNRGKSESGHFHNISELSHKESRVFESWSIEILKQFFNTEIKSIQNEQTLFDMDW